MVSRLKDYITMGHEHNSYPHWNYFLALEDDLDRLSRFVQFTAQNYGCYSIELARILMLASAEIDVVAKQLCKQIAPDARADKIHEYRRTIICRRTLPFRKIRCSFHVTDSNYILGASGQK